MITKVHFLIKQGSQTEITGSHRLVYVLQFLYVLPFKNILKVFLKEVSYAHQGCIFDQIRVKLMWIKKQTTVFYVNIFF